MDMTKWVTDTIAAKEKKGLPVLSFPAIQKMGITVKELISSSDYQARGMKIIAEETDSAAAVSLMDLSLEAEAFGSAIVVSDDEVPTVVGSIVGDEDEADALEIPKIGAGRTQIYIDAIKKAEELITDRPVFAGIIGPFSLAGRLMDVSETMIYCYEEPDMVHKVLEKTTKFLISYAKAYKEAGAQGVVMAEPLAGLLSPELAEEFSSDYVKRIVDAVQDDTFIVIYHNCGAGVTKSWKSIVDTGARAFHFGNAIKMTDIVPHIPMDRIVMGNVDPAGRFRNGTKEQVYESTIRIMKENCGSANFVISSGCDIPPLSPWENIHAFFDAVRDFYAGQAS